MSAMNADGVPAALAEVLCRPLPQGADQILSLYATSGHEGRKTYVSSPTPSGSVAQWALQSQDGSNCGNLAPRRPEVTGNGEGQELGEGHILLFAQHLFGSTRSDGVNGVFKDAVDWSPADHWRFRAEILLRFADDIQFKDGWESKTECLIDFATGLLLDLTMRGPGGQTMSAEGIALLLEESAQSVRGVPEVALLTETMAMAQLWNASEPKDRQLSALSASRNVAYFASFAATTAWPRYTNLDSSSGPHNASLEATISELLAASGSHSVNVRTFRTQTAQGNPFHYGITDVEIAAQLVRDAARDGYFTIVNETISVNDGGVSGVSLDNVIEFAPDSTPRSVEGADACRAPADVANRLIATVYGPGVEVPQDLVRRTEFSCHPARVGARATRTLVWESAEDQTRLQVPSVEWPNSFSRHIGDKTFGLIIAHLFGAMVPLTTVISRRVAPFTFGTATNTAEWWIRTAPSEAQPGLYTTEKGWRDPFELLASEDPGGLIAAVLAQEGVDAVWAGASQPGPTSGDHVIEGVAGNGDDFMSGRRDAEQIPHRVDIAVRSEIGRLEEVLGGIRTEWVWDGNVTWIVQLHRIGVATGGTVSDGVADRWLPFDPSHGLDALRALVADAQSQNAGVLVLRPVGVTSHIGDILRKAGVPGRFSGEH